MLNKLKRTIFYFRESLDETTANKCSDTGKMFGNRQIMNKTGQVQKNEVELIPLVSTKGENQHEMTLPVQRENINKVQKNLLVSKTSISHREQSRQTRTRKQTPKPIIPPESNPLVPNILSLNYKLS